MERFDPGASGPDESRAQVLKEEGTTVAQQARAATTEVAGTAKEQVRAVAGEARSEAGQLVEQVRERVGSETRSQTDRAAQSLRQWADDLASMAEGAKPDSPVRNAAYRVADGGRRAADYLEERGVGGLVDEVQAFARRRPGTFLASAALAGFAVGRLVKAAKGESAESGGEDRVTRGGVS